MKRKIERAFALLAALSFVCAPTLLMIIGFWMIYNVGLYIGLALSIVGYGACVWEYGQLQMWYDSRNSNM